MNEEFNLDAIEKTFTNYKKGQMFDGVVVIKREDGCISILVAKMMPSCQKKR